MQASIHIFAHVRTLVHTQAHSKRACTHKSMPTARNAGTEAGLGGCVIAAGQWKAAREVFEGMGASGCKPDAVTFSTLITAYDKGGQWPLALQVSACAHAHAD